MYVCIKLSVDPSEKPRLDEIIKEVNKTVRHEFGSLGLGVSLGKLMYAKKIGGEHETITITICYTNFVRVNYTWLKKVLIKINEKRGIEYSASTFVEGNF